MIRQAGMLLAVVLAATGCQSGATTVPPPGTITPGNAYYTQPPTVMPGTAGATFTPPGYGQGAAASPATGTTTPNFSPSSVNLASNNNAGDLNWRSVTQTPSISRSGSTINPQTTLTTIRGNSASTSTSSAATGATTAARANQPIEISQLPMVTVPSAHGATAATATPGTTATIGVQPGAPAPALTTPVMPTSPFGPPPSSSIGRDPWLGR